LYVPVKSPDVVKILLEFHAFALAVSFSAALMALAMRFLSVCGRLLVLTLSVGFWPGGLRRARRA
jgi:hypothetical protein